MGLSCLRRQGVLGSLRTKHKNLSQGCYGGDSHTGWRLEEAGYTDPHSLRLP